MSLARVCSLMKISYNYGRKFIIRLKLESVEEKPVRATKLRREYKQQLKDADRRIKLTPNMYAYIIDKDTVNMWAGYTLEQRSVMLHR